MIDTTILRRQNAAGQPSSEAIVVLTDSELAAVMNLPESFRTAVWMRLLGEGRVDFDYIRMAEGLERVDPLVPDEEPWSTVNFPTEVDDPIDITGGAMVYSYYIGRAIFFVLLALGLVTALRMLMRVLR